MSKQIHFIATGGSAMHNLAIALHLKGYNISGSDDEIFEPARGRLAKYGLLPATVGWDVSRITPDLEAVVLGMHARADNPELLRALELGVKVYSYPEYLYEQSRGKKRVVIGGSHGKTTVTAMILHVLQGAGIDCDYMVGAQLEGFEVMVRLSENGGNVENGGNTENSGNTENGGNTENSGNTENGGNTENNCKSGENHSGGSSTGAGIMIIEGDEYLTSPIDRRPKFHLYHPDIAVINGIAWDHINVFPTFENYVEQFLIFARSIERGGSLVYVDNDPEAVKIAAALLNERADVATYAAGVPPYGIKNGITVLDNGTPLKIFGKHNLQNLNVAWNVCRLLGVPDNEFLKQISTFKGASRRLELIASNDSTAVYKDFAHSPSKLQATIAAVKEKYPQRTLVACMELHTFSSLSKEFLSHYKGCMDRADVAIVYFNPHAVEHKKLPPITCEMIYDGFARKDLKVYNDSALLRQDLLAREWKGSSGSNLLWMTSGNFDGIDEKELAEKITY